MIERTGFEPDCLPKSDSQAGISTRIATMQSLGETPTRNRAESQAVILWPRNAFRRIPKKPLRISILHGRNTP